MLFKPSKNLSCVALPILLSLIAGCMGATDTRIQQQPDVITSISTISTNNHHQVPPRQTSKSTYATAIGLPLLVIGGVVAYIKRQWIKEIPGKLKTSFRKKKEQEEGRLKREEFAIKFNHWLDPILYIENQSRIQLTDEDKAFIEELAFGQTTWKASDIGIQTDLAITFDNQLGGVYKTHIIDNTVWRNRFVAAMQTPQHTQTWKSINGGYNFNPAAVLYADLWEHAGEQGPALPSLMDSIDRLARKLATGNFQNAKTTLLDVKLSKENNLTLREILSQQSPRQDALFLYTLVMLKVKTIHAQEEEIRRAHASQRISFIGTVDQKLMESVVEYISEHYWELHQEYRDWKVLSLPDQKGWIKDNFVLLANYITKTQASEEPTFKELGVSMRILCKLVYVYFSAEQQYWRTENNFRGVFVVASTTKKGEKIDLTIGMLSHSQQKDHALHAAARWLVSFIHNFEQANLFETIKAVHAPNDPPPPPPPGGGNNPSTL